MGGRGSFFENGGLSTLAGWQTVDYIDGIKVLAPKNPKASLNLPERSNVPGTAYIKLTANGTFSQLRMLGANCKPIYDIDYGLYQGKLSLHVHCLKGDPAHQNDVHILHPDDPLYEKYHLLFGGINAGSYDLLIHDKGKYSELPNRKTYLGVDLSELIELLSTGHEAEFTLRNKRYVIQPESQADDEWNLVLYQFEPEVDYLCRIPIFPDSSLKNEEVIRWPVGGKCIKQILNEKCFGGKSFLDLVDSIHVDNIF